VSSVFRAIATEPFAGATSPLVGALRRRMAAHAVCQKCRLKPTRYELNGHSGDTTRRVYLCADCHKPASAAAPGRPSGGDRGSRARLARAYQQWAAVEKDPRRRHELQMDAVRLWSEQR
jgi:hypothetical protein